MRLHIQVCEATQIRVGSGMTGSFNSWVCRTSCPQIIVYLEDQRPEVCTWYVHTYIYAHWRLRQSRPVTVRTEVMTCFFSTLSHVVRVQFKSRRAIGSASGHGLDLDNSLEYWGHHPHWRKINHCESCHLLSKPNLSVDEESGRCQRQVAVVMFPKPTFVASLFLFPISQFLHCCKSLI